MMLMSMKDHAVLEKKSLVMLKRSMSEAGTKVEIEFSGGKVTRLGEDARQENHG